MRGKLQCATWLLLFSVLHWRPHFKVLNWLLSDLELPKLVKRALEINFTSTSSILAKFLKIISEEPSTRRYYQLALASVPDSLQHMVQCTALEWDGCFLGKCGQEMWRGKKSQACVR